ncbi:DUF4214 domain-containing protein [Stutzerimonas chloritidismutans]
MVVRDYTALLSGNAWNAGQGEAPRGVPVFLTYSFAGTAFDDPPDNASNFRPLDSGQQALLRQGIEAWGAVSGITFLEAAPGLGDIEVAGYDLSPSWMIGQAGYPWAGWFVEAGNARLAGVEVPGAGRVYLDGGGMNLPVILHELGHALGLKHPHDGEPILHPDLDHSRYTALSYVNGGASGPGVLGELDIAAIQVLYGRPEQKGQQVSNWSWDAAQNRLTQVGWARDDVLTGTAAHDVIVGAGGNDLIVARGGNDLISVSGFAFQVDGGDGLDILMLDFASAETPHLLRYGDQYSYLARPGGRYEDMQVFNVERLAFTDGTLALDVEGVAGQAYRLYQAAFARTPDAEGLSFWISVMDAGESLHGVAEHFLASAEFASRYGASSSDEQLVGLLYQNVLGRAGDAEGAAFWQSQLGSGANDRAEVLVGFSESAENVALVGTVIDNGIWLA